MSSIPGNRSQTVAALRGAVKHYGATRALNGVDLDIRRGEVLALLGPNGAGKSTAISLWLGLNLPDQGTAELFGESPRNLTARRRIGVMLQTAQLPDTLRVHELLKLTAAYYPTPRSFDETVELAGLTDLLVRPYAKLSGGQQRRVQFALALIGRPELIFLDEPTTGLDLDAREKLWAAIRTQVNAGCAVLLTTHYLEEAEALADRVAVIARGSLVAEGSVDAIRARVAQKRLRAKSVIDIATARAWPGVTDASREGDWLALRATDAEAALRHWLAADSGLRELEVARAGLAEAFTELVRDDAAATAGALQ
jgi:ABC-2 type transport system ATP-binding protein